MSEPVTRSSTAGLLAAQHSLQCLSHHKPYIRRQRPVLVETESAPPQSRDTGVGGRRYDA